MEQASQLLLFFFTIGSSWTPQTRTFGKRDYGVYPGGAKLILCYSSKGFLLSRKVACHLFNLESGALCFLLLVDFYGQDPRGSKITVQHHIHPYGRTSTSKRHVFRERPGENDSGSLNLPTRQNLCQHEHGMFHTTELPRTFLEES